MSNFISSHNGRHFILRHFQHASVPQISLYSLCLPSYLNSIQYLNPAHLTRLVLHLFLSAQINICQTFIHGKILPCSLNPCNFTNSSAPPFNIPCYNKPSIPLQSPFTYCQTTYLMGKQWLSNEFIEQYTEICICMVLCAIKKSNNILHLQLSRHSPPTRHTNEFNSCQRYDRLPDCSYNPLISVELGRKELTSMPMSGGISTCAHARNVIPSRKIWKR